MASFSRDRVAQILLDRPNATYTEIAAEVGITRQRAHQIVKMIENPKPSAPRFIGKRRGPHKKQVVRGAIPLHENDRAHISTSSSGTISELITAANLMARGWFVFHPILRTSRCDLIALSRSGKTMLRIEVRTGRKTAPGDAAYAASASDIIDHHAVVVAGEEVHFYPRLPSPLDN